MLLTIYDVECNGLIRKGVYPDVYQLGYIRVDDKFKVHSFGSLYFYDSETFADYDYEAAAVHGISLDFLKSQEDDFLKNLSTAYGILNNCLVVGKNNIMFDNQVITRFLNKYRPEKVWPFSLGKSIDVQSYMGMFYREWCKSKGIEVSNRKSGTLADYMNVIGMNESSILQFGKNNGVDIAAYNKNRNSLHDALYDALLTYICLAYIMIIKKIQVNPV